MQDVDSQVLNQLLHWLRLGQRAWLATVVATWGSSPRPVGSLLACNQDGVQVGSLSGGCIEDDLIEQLRAGQLATDGPVLHRYGVTSEEAERFGLPCGGELQVLLEPVGPDHAQAFADICETLAKRQCVEREVDLHSGAMQVHGADRPASLIYEPATRLFRQTYGPAFHLFIIGAGMVSQYLAQMALLLDYRVSVCDPRPEQLDAFAVDGVRKLSGMPDDAVRNHANDIRTAVVALTHDPRIDDMGLMEALTGPAFYVGAMGSSRTSAKRRERLQLLDLDAAAIARLHAPVGLPIGSKTPPEIAVAILAEVTAVRQQQVVSSRSRLQAMQG